MNETCTVRQQTENLEREFLDFLVRSGNRITTPRKVVLQAVIACERNFDAESLYVKAKEIDPVISLTSVYRTLPMLIDAGILVESDLVDKKQRYRLGSFGTTQLLVECQQCGKVEELDPGCTRLQIHARLAQAGFAANRIQIKVKGLCRECPVSG
jgi:Fur family transcriptional regulator, ferric uptake regulator